MSNGYDDNFTKQGTGWKPPPVEEAPKLPRVVEQGPRAQKPRRMSPSESARARRELGLDSGLPRSRRRRSSRPLRTSRVRRSPRGADRQFERAVKKARGLRNPWARVQALAAVMHDFRNTDNQEPTSFIPNGFTRTRNCSNSLPIRIQSTSMSVYDFGQCTNVRQQPASHESFKRDILDGWATVSPDRDKITKWRFGDNRGPFPGLLPKASQNHEVWKRAAGVVASGLPHYGPHQGEMQNPNELRFSPGNAPSRYPGPNNKPEYNTGTQTSAPPIGVTISPQGKPSRAHQFARRQPPRRKRDKERKTLSRAAKIGIALYRALDIFSEGAEIVGAIYDALPKEVRKKWDRHALPGDQFGQYGWEGMDYKLRALYHNWDKVDVEQAVKNIIQNSIEDQVIGAYQKHMPKNTVNAFDQLDSTGRPVSPEEIVTQIMGDIFDSVGW